MEMGISFKREGVFINGVSPTYIRIIDDEFPPRYFITKNEKGTKTTIFIETNEEKTPGIKGYVPSSGAFSSSFLKALKTVVLRIMEDLSDFFVFVVEKKVPKNILDSIKKTAVKIISAVKYEDIEEAEFTFSSSEKGKKKMMSSSLKIKLSNGKTIIFRSSSKRGFFRTLIQIDKNRVGGIPNSIKTIWEKAVFLTNTLV